MCGPEDDFQILALLPGSTAPGMAYVPPYLSFVAG